MTDREILAKHIIEKGWLKRGGSFTLSCGKKSDLYIDLKPAILSSRYLHLFLVPMIQKLEPMLTTKTVLSGVVMSGVALTASLLQRMSSCSIEVDSCIARTSERDHGTCNMVEGWVRHDSQIIIIDDVATSGGSILKTVRTLRDEEFVVDKALVVVDREEGAKEMLEEEGIRLHSILTADDLKYFHQG
jgi:orotate phosphoribosyltransferase